MKNVAASTAFIGNRIKEGVVVETLLPDATVVQTFHDTYKSKNHGDKEVCRHLILRSDFSVVLADSEGHVSLVSSNTRQALIDDGSKTRIGKDTDYLCELDRAHREFTKGLYYAHVSAKE